MLGILLDRSLPRSLGSQLCDALRALVLSGALAGGARLPSSRELARELGISRTLVLEAFEQLEAEGYVEGRKGAGSFVVPGSALRGRRRAPPPRGLAGGRIAGARNGAAQAPRSAAFVDFKTGVPALDLFPREAWARELAAAARSLPAGAIGYGEGAGFPALREETAAYLFRSRGIRVEPEEVFITSGISQALGIVSRALLRRGKGGSRRGARGGERRGSFLREKAILENPCQPALSGLLAREGIELVAARVDGEGVDPALLPRDASAVAFVTPSHQYPLGPVLSAPRRAALVDWARATDSIVFEDDFDGEYRYGGAPLQPLRELESSRVVYAGSFSKAFAPALRLGYALVPPQLAESWRACRELMDIHSCVFTQAAMASCLASGAFERHVRRMRRVYAARRAALLGALAAAFGTAFGPAFGADVEVMGEAAGLHIALRFGLPRFKALRFDEGTVSRIASAGALVYPAARYAFAPFPGIERILLLGYGNLDEEAIGRGVAALASGIDSILRGGGG
jgi:GntR family transcriptional regulator / MocR family aminotransferase